MSEDQKPFSIHELQIENPEQKPSKCELCGSEVRVVGNTTLHYEPMQEPRVARDEQIEEAGRESFGDVSQYDEFVAFTEGVKWADANQDSGYIEPEVRQAYEALKNTLEVKHRTSNWEASWEKPHTEAIAALEARWPELKGAKE